MPMISNLDEMYHNPQYLNAQWTPDTNSILKINSYYKRKEEEEGKANSRYDSNQKRPTLLCIPFKHF